MRRLRLRREALTELTTTDLGSVVGGSGNSCQNVCNTGLNDCITGLPCIRTIRADCVATSAATC
jgi:hypothetical protein